MTEPTAQRPMPGPYRPGPAAAPAVPAADRAAEDTHRPGAAPHPGEDTGEQGADGRRLTGLEELPVAEHVAVFEAEHARLQRELGTIDPL
ncbi:hypothetical protein [Blastococcus montanus]|uniref:hypothetical protein n=1 Tax=Blastococcus montanus TaxID=3144973 RepID=UPI00320883E0